MYPEGSPPDLYYWEVVTHIATTLLALTLLYSLRWQRPSLALPASYWLLLAAAFHLVLLFTKTTGDHSDVILVHGWLATSYLYSSATVAAWIQLQTVLDKLEAAGHGELDYIKEQELEEVAGLTGKVEEEGGWCGVVGRVGRQREDEREGREEAWRAGVGREEVAYMDTLYSIHWAWGHAGHSKNSPF